VSHTRTQHKSHTRKEQRNETEQIFDDDDGTKEVAKARDGSCSTVSCEEIRVQDHILSERDVGGTEVS